MTSETVKTTKTLENLSCWLKDGAAIVDAMRRDLLAGGEDPEPEQAGRELPDMRSIRECCDALSLSRAYVQQLVDNGKVPWIRCGKKRLVNFGVLCRTISAGEGNQGEE